MEIRDKEELQDKARGNKQGFLKHIFFGVIFWGGDKFAEIQYQKKVTDMPFFFFFISKYTEYCHSTGFASFQVSRSLPFLRQGNQDIRSFNYLQIFTEVASGLRQTQSGRNLATAAEFHKKLSVPVGGRLFSGRTFLTFLRPSSVATSFEQIKLP